VLGLLPREEDGLSEVAKTADKWGKEPRLEVWREAEGLVVYYADRTSEALKTREDLYRIADAFYREKHPIKERGE
jgi:hypothetical protein